MFRLIPRVRVNYNLKDLIRGIFISEKSHVLRQECENFISDYYDGRHVVLTPSGRDALYEILIRLPQEKVIIPAYNCVAVTEAAMLARKHIVYSPLDRGYNSSYLDDIAANSIVIATHQYGIPCDINCIAEKCKEVGAILIEDCATSVGSTVEGKLTGTFGDYTILSFNASKLINVPLSGGAILSSDSYLIDEIKESDIWKDPDPIYKIKGRIMGLAFVVLKNSNLYRIYHYFSMGRKGLHRRRNHDVMSDSKTALYTYRFSEWQASILLRQLKSLDILINKRKEIYSRYDRDIFTQKVVKPTFDTNAVCCRYAIQVDERDVFYRRSLKKGVDLDFSHDVITCNETFTRAHEVANRVVNLPCYYDLKDREIKRIVKTANHIKVLVLEGYCKQCLPFIRGFKELGCEVTVLCNSRLDCSYVSRLPDYRIIGVCDLQRPKESEEYMLQLIRTGTFDVVFPPFDFSARILAHHEQELSKFARICVNEKMVFDRANDKEYVMKICAENQIPTPKTYLDVHSVKEIDHTCYPIIIKPKSLYGARGFHIFNSAQELNNYITDNSFDISDYVIQEFIPQGSDLITGNLYIDKDGEIKSAYLYKSEHVYPEDGGTSTLNGIYDNDKALEDCKRLAKIMQLKGIIGIDMMVDKRDHVAKVIEINPRSSHGVTLGFISGVNHAQQILEDAMGQTVSNMKVTRKDTCVRISQTDFLWWLSSYNRFKFNPKKLGYRHVKEQMFFFDDPLPWFAYLLSGIVEFRKKMKEKRK